MSKITLHHGDCLEVLRGMLDNSVDACVTDPPYGLGKEPDALAMLRDWMATGHHDVKSKAGFMGKSWDSFVPQPLLWHEVLRVLKPGGHVVAFAGSRTYDLMALGLRIAGFEIRDMTAWLHGQGMAKSLNISKAIDQAADYKVQAAVRRAAVFAVEAAGLSLPGNSRHDWTIGGHAPGNRWWSEFQHWLPGLTDEQRDRVEGRIIAEVRKTTGWFTRRDIYTVSAPATPEAKAWDGWYSGLKPAIEPAVLARKPLEGTIATNVLKWGTGGLNVDGCRIPTSGDDDGRWGDGTGHRPGGFGNVGAEKGGAVPCGKKHEAGRFPANVCHDGSDSVLRCLPSGTSTTGKRSARSKAAVVGGTNWLPDNHESTEYTDSGSPARFWFNSSDEMPSRIMYHPKANKKDRAGSKHVTVKPVNLLRWLVKLTCPPGGVVLDPFAGSGTTGEAAFEEGFDCIMIEREAEYFADIQRRLEGIGAIQPTEDTDLFGDIPTLEDLLGDIPA